MAKKKIEEITVEMCESKADFDLFNHAKSLVDRANELIDAGNVCIQRNHIMKGKFSADAVGMLGVGFRFSDGPKYLHLFGVDGKKVVEKQDIKCLQMPYKTDDIDAYFKDLRFVNPTNFVSL